MTSPTQTGPDRAQHVSDRYLGVIGHFASGICMAAPTYQSTSTLTLAPPPLRRLLGIGDYIFRNNTVITVETRTGAESP